MLDQNKDSKRDFESQDWVPKSDSELQTFSEVIEYFREGISVRVEDLTRNFRSYFTENYWYTIKKIWEWKFQITKWDESYVFVLYSDSEMKTFADKYFYPALSNPWEPWVRKQWYWNQAPEYVSWGWYFKGKNNEIFLTNPFK